MKGIFGILFVLLLTFPALLMFRRPRNLHVAAKLFIVGIIVPLPAILLEMITIPLSGLVPESLAIPSRAFLGIALVEELAKFAAIILVAHRRQDFGRMTDGAAYGICLALGFALTENILYVIGAELIRQTAILRILTATPLHVLTGGLMGFFWARNRLYGKRGLTVSVLLAITFHGLYNQLLT